MVFDEVREKNLEHLKLLNSVIFPVKIHVSMSQHAAPLKPTGAAANSTRVRDSGVAQQIGARWAQARHQGCLPPPAGHAL